MPPPQGIGATGEGCIPSGCGFVKHGLDVCGGEVVLGGVGDGAELGIHRAWMGGYGLVECLADPNLARVTRLESGKVPWDFSVFQCRLLGLVGVFAWVTSLVCSPLSCRVNFVNIKAYAGLLLASIWPPTRSYVESIRRLSTKGQRHKPPERYPALHLHLRIRQVVPLLQQ